MAWNDIWHDPETGRLRSGWRLAIFLIVALPLTLVLLSGLSTVLIMLGLVPDQQQLASLVAFKTIQAISAIMVFGAVGIWALRVFDRLPAVTLGIFPRGRWLYNLALGFGAGVAFVALLIVILWAAGLAEFSCRACNWQAAWPLLAAILGFALFAAEEEIIFRGYPFQTLLRGAGPLATLFLTSAFFAAVHLINPAIGALPLTNLFLAGVLLGMLYLRSGALWLPIGFHAGWNFCQAAVGAPVSGIDVQSISPLTLTLTGPALVSGGAFGLEGGVIASALLLAIIAVLVHARIGLPLESRWWEWPQLRAPRKASPVWDFSIGSRYYQWKLLPRDSNEP